MILIWLAAGISVGLVNALTIRFTVSRLGEDSSVRGLGRLIAGMFGRWIVAAALMAVALGRGMVEGVLALTGFGAARWVAILWWSYKRQKATMEEKQ